MHFQTLQNQAEEFKVKSAKQIVDCHWERTDSIRSKENVFDWEGWFIIAEDQTAGLKHAVCGPFLNKETGTIELNYPSYIEPHLTAEMAEFYARMFFEKFPDCNTRHETELQETLEQDRRWHKELEAKQARQAAIEASIPRCPHCHSKNIQKISTAKRVVSTELLGLASPTIGKTMECKSCGYKW